MPTSTQPKKTSKQLENDADRLLGLHGRDIEGPLDPLDMADDFDLIGGGMKRRKHVDSSNQRDSILAASGAEGVGTRFEDVFSRGGVPPTGRVKALDEETHTYL